MKWEMEILSPTSYNSNSSWPSKTTKWTKAENKAFENALAMYDKDTPDRWQKVAEMVPGKSVMDVMRQYKELEDDVSSIEAGLVPIPGYSNTSPFTLEWGSSHGGGYDVYRQAYGGGGGKRTPSGRSCEQERKKGVPWTEEEHKLFLMGLKKYGKGDWRNISRNFVFTRTPTQVASHAQKYFIRQLSGGKDKRRASIHDITTVNLNDDQSPTADNKRPPTSDQPNAALQQPNSPGMQKVPFQWNQMNHSLMAFNAGHGNSLMPNPYGMSSYGQSLQRGAMHESYFGSQNMAFQIKSENEYHHA